MNYLKYSIVVFICILAFSFSPHQVFASGSCHSNGVGTSWNTGADWTAGCSGAGGIPGTGDIVTILPGNPITLDVDTPALGELHIYDTLDTSSSNHAINVTSGSASDNIYIEIGGTLNANGSTITLSGGFQNLGVFNAGASTVDFNLNNPGVIFIYGTVAFYNLVFNPTMTGSLSSQIGGTAITVNNNFTINPSAASALTFTATMTCPITVMGTLSVAASSSARSVFDTGGYALSAGAISIANQATLNGNASTINVTGTSGTLFTNNGTFNRGTSTVNFSGNGSATLLSGVTPFYNLTSSGAGTKSQGSNLGIMAGGTLSVTNGIFDPGSASISNESGTTLAVASGAQLNVDGVTFNANYAAFANFSFAAGSTINYNAAGSQTIDSTKTYSNLSISGSGTKSLSGVTTVTGILTLNGGSFDTGSSNNYTTSIGSLVLNGGTFIPNASTINLTGTGVTLLTVITGGASVGTGTFNLTGNGDATLLSSGQSWTFYNLTSSGTGTKSLAGGASVVLNAPGVFSVTNGTFDMGTGTFTSSGGSAGISITNATLNIGAPTFVGNFSGFATPTFGMGSTVNYNGSGTQAVSNSTQYYNLTISNGPREVDFSTTGTTIVTHVFTANGSAGNVLDLFSTSSGAHWIFIPSGTASVSYVAVKDGSCGAGAISFITQTNFTNLGNNGTCWVAASIVAPSVSRGGHAVAVINPSATSGYSNLDFTINNGASNTISPTISLGLNADPNTVKGYAVSLDQAFAGTGIQPYTNGTTGTFELPNTPGIYTVYLEYFSTTGKSSAVISHAISYKPTLLVPVDSSTTQSNTITQTKNVFTRVLKLGSSGSDVTLLQRFLVKDGELVLHGENSYGNFGKKTQQALEKFQTKHGIIKAGMQGYGIFGPKTQGEVGMISNQ